MTATIRRDSPRYSDFVGTFDAETVQILPDRTREGNLKIAFDVFPDALQREIAAKAARRGRKTCIWIPATYRQKGYVPLAPGDDLLIEDGYKGLFE